jgi:hypothetical protein
MTRESSQNNAIIALVACVAAKRNATAPARDLYTSPLFRKASAYAERHSDRWFILSALHGVVSPDDPIAPYNVTLNRMPVAERRNWSKRVLAELLKHAPEPAHFIILAGDRYRAGLLQPLRERGHTIELPLEGLTIGRQLAWLTRSMA